MPKRHKLLKFFGVGLLVCLAAAVLVLWFNAVPKTVTDEDREYIEKFTAWIPKAGGADGFDKQIEFIRAVQDSVLNIVGEKNGVGLDEPREPRNLYETRDGLCYDRSRVIEKILGAHGFDTRHVFVYSIREGYALTALAGSGLRSYAATEVRTERGWLLIDPDSRWAAVDAAGSPRTAGDLMDHINGSAAIEWQSEPPNEYANLAPFTYVYGVYSRHGRFYPPYAAIPDINYEELIENF